MTLRIYNLWMIPVYGEATIREVVGVKKLLGCYIAGIGQVLNEGKSQVVFFKIEKTVMERIRNILRFLEASLIIGPTPIS